MADITRLEKLDAATDIWLEFLTEQSADGLTAVSPSNFNSWLHYQTELAGQGGER